MKLTYFSATRALTRSGPAISRGAEPSATLLRPYLDLDGDGGPINARTCRHVGRQLLDDAADLPPQGNTRSGLRSALVAESAAYAYAVGHPAELASALRGEAWQRLVDDIERWPGVDTDRRLKVVTALNKLTFNAVTLDLVPPLPAERIAADDSVALLALKRASAASKQLQPIHAVERMLVEVARTAPAGGRARLGAAINLTVHFARVTKDIAATVEWADVVMAELSLLRGDTAVDRLRASAALRAASFGPFFARRTEEVTAMLAEAEAMAVDLIDDPGIPTTLAEENLYALWETRANEARLLGDRDRSYQRVTDMITLDPLEPKTRLQLGDLLWDDGRIAEAEESFLSAALLGVPFTSVSWYCVGRCRERLGDLDAARDAYLASLAVDPLAVSSLVRLRAVAAQSHAPLAAWAGERLESLHRHGQQRHVAAMPTPNTGSGR